MSRLPRSSLREMVLGTSVSAQCSGTRVASLPDRSSWWMAGQSSVVITTTGCGTWRITLRNESAVDLGDALLPGTILLCRLVVTKRRLFRMEACSHAGTCRVAPALATSHRRCRRLISNRNTLDQTLAMCPDGWMDGLSWLFPANVVLLLRARLGSLFGSRESAGPRLQARRAPGEPTGGGLKWVPFVLAQSIAHQQRNNHHERGLASSATRASVRGIRLAYPTFTATAPHTTRVLKGLPCPSPRSVDDIALDLWTQRLPAPQPEHKHHVREKKFRQSWPPACRQHLAPCSAAAQRCLHSGHVKALAT